MKKFITVFLCVLLLGAAVGSASASGSAHMNLSASSGTVYRGDTFSISVSLANDQPVGNGGITLSFDSSAFEIVGGSCYVSNAILSEVSAANGGGVFMLQTDAVVSGTIFSIQMRVKDTAAFGTYSISGTPSLNISCGISGTSVTVACRHSYGGASRVDAGSHVSTCTICGNTKTEGHAWNEGTVDKAATCKETGSKTLTCTACGAAKTETIAVSTSHSYGSWTKTNDSSHAHTCSVCGKTESGSHSWNTGKVTTNATCQQTGSRTRTCTACGASKKETIPLADHSCSVWEQVDETSHTRACTVCGKEETAEHTYSEAWEHDETDHYHSCTGCGFVKDTQAHVPGAAPTETEDQVCTVCLRVLLPNTAHEHIYQEEWLSDEQAHWRSCANCNDKGSLSGHTYTDECDTDCDVCGYVRTAPHAPGESLSSDETGHWYPCRSCGEMAAFARHTPGAEATVTSPQLCADCGYEIAGILPHDPVYDEGHTVHWHECACGERYETDLETCPVCGKKDFPWWSVCIAEAVLFGGTLAFVLLRGRKKKSPEEQQITGGAEQEPTETENLP